MHKIKNMLTRCRYGLLALVGALLPVAASAQESGDYTGNAANIPAAATAALTEMQHAAADYAAAATPFVQKVGIAFLAISLIFFSFWVVGRFIRRGK